MNRTRGRPTVEPLTYMSSSQELGDPSNVVVWSQALRNLQGEDISTSLGSNHHLFYPEVPPSCFPPAGWFEELWHFGDAFL